VNYDDHLSPPLVAHITLPDSREPKEARLESPDGGLVKLNWINQDRSLILNLPAVEIYSVVILEF
jgi:hypothetical protein